MKFIQHDWNQYGTLETLNCLMNWAIVRFLRYTVLHDPDEALRIITGFTAIKTLDQRN